MKEDEEEIEVEDHNQIRPDTRHLRSEVTNCRKS